MKINVYCIEGSPTGVIPEDVHGKGVGGAELALLTWASAMAARGHDVNVFNDPRVSGMHEGALYLPRTSFSFSEEPDVLITFRGAAPSLPRSAAGVNVFWSCDQYTIGSYDKDVFPWVDVTVTISPYHKAYFLNTYSRANQTRLEYIDLGVRTWEYQEPVEKVPYQMIFCSVPDRGLDVVAQMWPKLKRLLPEATLVITSDYRLWGVPYPGDTRFRATLSDMEGVRYLGKVPRKELVELQMQSDLMFYPCTYEELFCIAAAECQVAGAFPITTSKGALATTNAYGKQRHPEFFVGTAVTMLEHKDLQEYQHACRVQALARFNWERICSQWEQLLGEYV